MKLKKILTVVLLFGSFALLSADPINVESEYGWKMLTIPVAPSVSAMAGTGVSASQEASTFIEHPAAGLVNDINSLSASQSLWIFDTQLNSVAINTSSGYRSFGFALRALDYGKLDARDITGEVIGEFHPLDLNLIANFAQRLTPNYYVGINMMMLYQKIQSNSSTGLAFDLGMTYLPPFRGLTINTAVKHIGMTTRVDRSRIKLPVTPELGISYEFPLQFADILTEGRIQKFPDESNITAQIGTNININRMLNLRTGYYLNHDTRSYTAGIGLELRKIDFNYAFLPFGNDISDAHSFGITYKF